MMNSAAAKTTQCCSPPNPKSWQFCGLLWSGVLVAYTLRVNISVAAQQMRDDLGWSETQKGLILSAFYWGYAIGQLPASHFAMLNGAKLMFGMSVLIPSLLTIIFPFAAERNFVAALFVRMLTGLVEAGCFPAIFHFFPHWIPDQDKTIMVPATLSGVYLGEMVAFFFSGLIIPNPLVTPQGYELGGWRGTFYVFGLCGCLWFPIWMRYAHETPGQHPTITREEIAYIQQGYEPLDLADDYSSSLQTPAPAPALASRSVSVNTPLSSEHRERTPSGVFGERLLAQTGSAGSQYDENFNSAPSYGSYREPLLTPGHEGSSGLVNRERLGSNASVSSQQSRHSLAAAVLSPVGISSGGAQFTPNPNPDSPPLSAWQELAEIYRRTPWGLILSSPAILTLFVASFTNGYIGFLLLSEMPSYLTDELGFDLGSAGILCVVPYTALFITSLMWGSIFYALQVHYNWSTRTVRQVSQFLAFGCSSMALLVAAFVKNRWLAYACLIVAQGLLGANQSGLACCYLDICPNFSPLLNTIGNTLSALAGIIGPIIVGAILTAYKDDTMGWQIIFVTTTALSFFSLALWYVFQTSSVDVAMNRGVERPPAIVKREV